jgi:hypothetical protein
MAMIALTDAARALHWTYWRTRDALLSGKLRGTRTGDGRWLVELASVNELLAARAAARPETAAPVVA